MRSSRKKVKDMDDLVDQSTLILLICTYLNSNLNNKCALSFFPCFLPCYFTGPDAPADLSPAKDFSELESQSSPSAAAVKQDILPPPVGAVTTDKGEEETSKLVKNNLTDDKDMELMDVHEDGTQTEGKESHFYVLENQTHSIHAYLCFHILLATAGLRSNSGQ